MKSLLLVIACLAAPVPAQAEIAPRDTIKAAIQAHRDGKLDEALRIVTSQFGRIAAGVPDTAQDYFITMFEWSQLVRVHAGARAAMINERDAQANRLLAGDTDFADAPHRKLSRFQVIMEMNRTLQDNRSTYRLVTQLLADNPEFVRRELFLAMPAIVEAGDYALVVKYIENPLPRLVPLNKLARELPFFPAAREAPRLGAELSIYMRDVYLLSKALAGLGKEVEAAELRNAAVKGIASDELRAHAMRELEAPGSIIKAIVEHQSGQEYEAADAPI